MIVTLAAADLHSPLAEIDLGKASQGGSGYFDSGDLANTGGNLYLFIDGVEYGSLFFMLRTDGRLSITLGQFDPDTQDWEDRNPLTDPVSTDG